MAYFPRLEKPERGDAVSRSILLPFVYGPLGFTLIVHLFTRVHWLLSKFSGSVPPPH